MATSRSEITIDRAGDEVWAAIRDYGDLEWRGGAQSCVVDGDVRIVMAGELVVEETRFAYDEAARTFTYGVTGMQGPTILAQGDATSVDLASMVGHHRATLTVVPVDDGSCRVVYDLELDDGHDETMESTTGQYRSVLQHLRDHLA